ncbi:hypothetical protein ACYCSE_22465 [Paenibacillus sp. SEL1]
MNRQAALLVFAPIWPENTFIEIDIKEKQLPPKEFSKYIYLKNNGGSLFCMQKI